MNQCISQLFVLVNYLFCGVAYFYKLWEAAFAAIAAGGIRPAFQTYCSLSPHAMQKTLFFLLLLLSHNIFEIGTFSSLRAPLKIKVCSFSFFLSSLSFIERNIVEHSSHISTNSKSQKVTFFFIFKKKKGFQITKKKKKKSIE